MAASALATAEYPAPLFGQRQQQTAVAASLTKTEQEATPTTEAVEVPVGIPASDVGSTLQHGGSIRSNHGSPDDRLTPFPPYHEPEESIYEESVNVVMTDPNGLSDDSAERSPSPVPGRQTPPAGLAAPAELVATTQPAQPAEQEEEEEEEEQTEQAEQAEQTEPVGAFEKLLATVRQPLSPPYWMHSRGSDGAGILDEAVAVPNPHEHVWPSARATPPPSITSAASTPRLPSQPTYRLGALSLPVFRPPWSPSWPGSSSRQAQTAKRPDDGAAAAFHDRDSSTSSVNFITLQDNDALPEEDGVEQDRDRDRTGAAKDASNTNNNNLSPSASRCWAQRVDVTGFVVVGGRGGGLVAGGGSSTGGGNTGSGMGSHSLGSFVVWTIRVQTLQGGAPLLVHKRYSEFDALRRRLVTSFPTSCAAAVPPLPPKSVLNNFRPSFLEQRRLGLQYFLNCILLNPEFSGSPVLKEFLFS